ncbi:TonB-dependent receptor [Flavobacterium sp. MK4S-17]|uniref:TonB-dependent receptor n=1 Tax=Flavobacterium sp. MK4S-17 TaxID=2543737 RepID=UPI00135BFE7B|nr:TonB-dependent receptor [Flavobacterium sp. MK4S-17]
MKLKFLFITLLFTALGFSQGNGTVKGTVTDKDMNNQTLPFASVTIKGSPIGTNTDENGSYSLKIPAGSHILVFGFLGYESVEVPITIKDGETKTINQALASTSVLLEDVVIEKTVSREKESALLLDQKNAVEIKQNIGAQEMARKGVSDVATAVSKTTGISKQEGSGSVYVRGLGDRYNLSTMNGLPLPSNNPSRKNIQLDIFSADIVEYIGIDKTYTPKNYGDFAGANIDIASKVYKGDGFFDISIGTGVNTNAVNQDKFYLQDGPSFTGFSNQKQPNNPLSGYNFTTNWNRETQVPVNSSISLKGGDSYDVGEEGRLNFFTVGSFDSEYGYREGVGRSNVTAQGIARKDLYSRFYTYATNTTLMGNVNYKINMNHSVKFNSVFINSTSQRMEEYDGIIDIYDNSPNGGGFIRRSTFDRTALYINQLLGNSRFTDQLDLDWGVSYNIVNNVIPDRMQNTLMPVDNNGDLTVKTVSDLANSDNHRYFQDLNENEAAANIFANYKFDKGTDDLYKGKISAGYSGRYKTVDFEATQYNFVLSPTLPQPVVERNDIDAYFNQANLDAGLFSIATFRGGLGSPNALRPQTYEGDQTIHAGLVSVEYSFIPQLTIIAGARVENIVQNIEWSTAVDPLGGEEKFNQTKFLPSLSAKYEINDKQNLKFAASKTYTLPQFKERAPFQYEEVLQIYVGNEFLYPSTNYNFDLKWEYFPDSNEIISATVFGKYIQDPINEVTIASATNDVSYVNTGDRATAIGGEVEMRKDIFNFKHGEDSMLNNALSFGANATYMKTTQDFSSEKVVNETDYTIFFTNDKGSLTGASDWLVNADVSYFYEFKKEKNLMATLAYNYYSDRLFAIGTNNTGDIVDKAVGTLDFIFKSDISKNLSVGLSLRNILDPKVERVQVLDKDLSTVDESEVNLLSYRKGMFAKLSVTYHF